MRHSRWTVLFVWIMWIHTQGAGLDSWSASGSYTSQKQCATDIEEKLETWSRFKDAKLNGPSVTFSETKTIMTYSCLADPEDPRKTKPLKPTKTN
jgi:hypothetical protein